MDEIQHKVVDEQVVISGAILPPAQPIVHGETQVESINRLKGMAESPVTTKSLRCASLLPVVTSTPIKMSSSPIPDVRRTVDVIEERENPKC